MNELYYIIIYKTMMPKNCPAPYCQQPHHTHPHPHLNSLSKTASISNINININNQKNKIKNNPSTNSAMHANNSIISSSDNQNTNNQSFYQPLEDYSLSPQQSPSNEGELLACLSPLVLGDSNCGVALDITQTTKIISNADVNMVSNDNNKVQSIEYIPSQHIDVRLLLYHPSNSPNAMKNECVYMNKNASSRPTQTLVSNKQFIILDRVSKKYCSLYLTTYRILMILNKNPPNCQPHSPVLKSPKSIMSIPYSYIQDIKKYQKYYKVITKLGLTYQLFFEEGQTGIDDGNRFYQLVKEWMAGMLPFCYTCTPFSTGANSISPNIYDSYAQIQRMRLPASQYSIFKNSNYKFCPTYPMFFIVQVIPKGVDIDTLEEVKKCRNGGRIAVMSYYNQNLAVGLWRVAGRRAGQGHRFDAAYFRAIPGNTIIIALQSTTPQPVGPTSFPSFISQFSTSNPFPACFPSTTLTFLPLPTLQSNFLSLLRHYNTGIQNPLQNKLQFYRAISKWFSEIDHLITEAYNIVQLVNGKNQVVLEESYAWDRCCQLLVIYGVIVQPFYRTLDGFAILIQKQFISFSHPFLSREYPTYLQSPIPSLSYNPSPIFIQTLQCIHQLVCSHPTAFEYTSQYLAQLAYQVYSGKYRNFCELGRFQKNKKEEIYTRCCCVVWQQLGTRRANYSIQYQKDTQPNEQQEDDKKHNTQYKQNIIKSKLGSSNQRNKKLPKQLWQMRKKPSIKQYNIWVQYYDMVCKMQGQNIDMHYWDRINTNPIPNNAQKSQQQPADSKKTKTKTKNKNINKKQVQVQVQKQTDKLPQIK